MGSKIFRRLGALGVFAFLLMQASLAQPSNTITYQGSLQFQGQPYTGDADYVFSLWTTESGGAAPVAIDAKFGIVVTDGLFTTTLDFGTTPFVGDRWLAIAVRTPAWDGTGAEPMYTELPERQRVNASPYSIQTRGIFVNEAGDRVGIGTTTPLAPMHIVSHQGLLVGENATSGGHTTLSIGLSGATNGYARLQATRLSGSAVGNIVLNDAGGNVGVGTSNPQARLHVLGDAIVTSTLRANSGVEFASGAKVSDVRRYGPIAFDPGPVAPDAIYAQFFSAPGVMPSDFVMVSTAYIPNLLLESVQVTTNQTILVVWRSISGITIDPPPSTISFMVFKP